MLEPRCPLIILVSRLAVRQGLRMKRHIIELSVLSNPFKTKFGWKQEDVDFVVALVSQSCMPYLFISMLLMCGIYPFFSGYFLLSSGICGIIYVQSFL